MLGRRLLIWCWASTVLAGWGGQVLAQERSLSDLAFMSGCWRGKLAREDGTIEERHNPPAAGVMLGTSQVIVGGKTTFFELIKIEQSSEGIAMNPFPMGNKSVAFKLVSSGPNKAVFENLEHDFPKRILYQLRDDGSLVARIEGGRPEQTEEFLMKAIACEAGAPVQPSTAAAQEAPKSPGQRKFLEEINRDIWIPFSQAYATGNADQYLGLHSKDFIRGQGDSKRVMSLAQYSEGVRRSFQRWKADGLKADLQFRFLERMANDQLGSERGIYQLSLTDPKGEVRRFYGKFHVVSRKENGVRKILVDYDSSEGDTIDEKTYQSGFALDDFDR